MSARATKFAILDRLSPVAAHAKREPRVYNLTRYLLAPLTVLIATIIRSLLSDILGESAPLLIFVMPVMISAWYGGLGPGLLATALGLMAGIYIFIPPYESFRLQELVGITRSIIFIVEGIGISILAAQFHSTLRNLVDSNRQAVTSFESLKKSETRAESVLNHVADGFLTINQDGRIETWNRAACDMFGYPKEEVIGRDIRILIPADDFNFEKLREGRSIEVTGLRKNGLVFPLELAMNEFRVDGNTYYTAILRDISGKVETAKKLHAAKESAEAASRAKSQFLANMSHEIRTPLGVIIGFTDLALAKEQSDIDRVHALQIIRRNAHQLSVLIDEVLDLSRVESGRLQIEKVCFDLVELLDDLRAALSIKAREKGITFSIESLGPVPTQLHSDPTRLRQILINLCSNAIKFTQRGGVRLTLRSVFPADPLAPVTVKFEVSDTGIGISHENQSKLFRPFSQLDASINRRFGGSGLGLALSRKFAQALGGDLVLARSEPTQGSTFVLTILDGPADQEVFQSIPRQEMDFGISLEHVDSEPKIVSDDRTLHGLTVLLVEDSPDNRIMISRFLKKAGAEVKTAVDGEDGVKKALEGGPDVVVMDIQMPGKDGHAATADLRQQGFTKPIIALTAHAMLEERQKSLTSGFDEYLTKPVNRQDLVGTIQRLAT
jgi:ammonium transporter, Amt family